MLRTRVASVLLPVYAWSVRPHVLAGCMAVLLPAISVLTVTDACADFDPSGRSKKPPGKPPATSQPGPAAPKPQGKPAAPASEDTSEGKAGPSSDALIARYTAIVLSQPSAPFPLQRLSQLYRERDGNLKNLALDFEKRASGSGADAWAARVVL